MLLVQDYSTQFKKQVITFESCVLSKLPTNNRTCGTNRRAFCFKLKPSTLAMEHKKFSDNQAGGGVVFNQLDV